MEYAGSTTARLHVSVFSDSFWQVCLPKAFESVGVEEGSCCGLGPGESVDCKG